MRRTPGKPTHAAASAKKPMKGTGEDRNSSLVVPDAPNTSTNPDVTHKFSAPENQGVTVFTLIYDEAKTDDTTEAQ